MRYYTLISYTLVWSFLISSPWDEGDTKRKDTKAEAMKKELKRLAGTWELVFMGSDGKQIDFRSEDRKAGRVSRLTILKDGSVEGEAKDHPRCKYKIDPTARPKTFDLVFPRNKWGRQPVVIGIYELDGDELWLCTATIDFPRPPDFTFGNGSNRILEIFRRVKDKK